MTSRMTRYQQYQDEIAGLCGSGGGGSRFTTVDEVRAYFQHDALVDMFGDANIPDQDHLDYLAELIIDEDPGSYTTWGDIEEEN